MRPLLLILTSALISATAVTGTWSGPIELTRDGETRSATALLELKQEGAKVTSTIGPNASDGTDLTLEAVVADQELRVTIWLKLDGQKLAGEFKVAGPNGQHMSGKMNLDRAK